MRPRLLEIEGLQSFRDRQKIDFSCLGETGLFGIFGPTGSGKSTVLDAITFALYGKVKRAERGTQGIINTGMDTAKVSFTFELLKDGDRKTYKVERTYARKKGSDNSCEPKVARLIQVAADGEIPVCDKASEVSSSIEELIGLSHDDFTRAVVLPQNSFQEFLMLDSSKKRDMLERIFYLDEYGKNLWEKLNRKIAALKSRIDVLSGELMGYSDATGEALEAARHLFETAAAEREKAEKELKLLEAKFNEAREVWQLVQELVAVEEREKRQELNREEISKKRVTLERASNAEGLLDIIRKNQETSQKLKDTEGQLGVILNSLPDTGARLSGMRRQYEALKKEAAARQPELMEQRARFSEALSIKSELAVIQGKFMELQTSADKLKSEILDKNSIIRQEEKESEALEQKLGGLHLEAEALKTPPDYRQKLQEGAKLETEVESAGRNAEESRNKAEELKRNVLKLEEKANGLKSNLVSSQGTLDALEAEMLKHQAMKPDDREAVQKDREELNKYKSAAGILQFRKEEIDGLNSRLEMQHSRHRNLTKVAENLEDVKAKALELFEKCRDQMECKNQELDRNTAHMLSKSLVDGEPCPVCGSLHHPNPASEGDEADVSELERQAGEAKEQYINAEKALRDVERSALAADEQVKAAAEQIEPLQKELESKIKEYDNQKLTLPEKLRSFGPEEMNRELETLEAGCTARLAALDAWEKKLEEYRSEVQKLKNKLVEDKLAEKGIHTELKITAANRDQAEAILAELKNALINKQQSYSAFLQLYKIGGAAAELARIMENDRKIDLLQKEAEDIRGSLALRRSKLERSKEELGKLGNNLVMTETDAKNLAEQKDGKEIKIKEIAGEADIEAEIGSIGRKLEEYAILEKQYREELDILEKQYNDLIARKSTLENQRDIYSGSYRNEQVQLNSALPEKGFGNIEEVEKAVLPKEVRNALADEIKENEKAWTNIQAQKDIFLKQLNSRGITDEEWNRISGDFRQQTDLKEECVSRCEAAKSSFNSLKVKHGKWEELSGRYAELTKKFGLLDTIGRLLRSDRGKDNSFIDYIAEERLAYVAAKASETLGAVTGYRYALELDTDSGFIIRDNANGGVHRMVTSLSGGETFLTSLSLALALSEQIQLKGQSPLEFFFLDEGFGTLDAGLLDTVIDSLERLSSKERVIGLISHVPELKGRMARRLIVDPPSMQGEGSRVRIEKA